MQTDGKSLPQRPHCFLRHLPRSSDLLLLNYKRLPAAIHNAHVAQGEHKHFTEASIPRLQQVTKENKLSSNIKGMQAYYHYHHFVNTADIHKGSIVS